MGRNLWGEIGIYVGFFLFLSYYFDDGSKLEEKSVFFIMELNMYLVSELERVKEDLVEGGDVVSLSL